MLKAKTSGIPLGSTGLKLTQFGGNLGYNYELNYNTSKRAFTGNPINNRYLIGLILGVADISDMMEVTGNSIVQFGNRELDLSLIGTIKAPRNKPIFTGKLNANYSMPSHVVSGDISTTVKIPSSSGKVFRGDFGVDFYAGNGNWSVSSSGISASILQQITFIGNFNIEGKLSTNYFKGKLAGSASYNYHRSYNFEVLGADLYANLKAGFNFNGMINLDENGLEGQLKVLVEADGTLGVDYKIYSGSIDASGSCYGLVKYANEKGYLEGKLHTEVDLYFWEEEVDVELNTTF